MPLPRYQSIKKRPRCNNKPLLNELDDYCLSKIIGYTLALSSQADSEANFGDNGKQERNLSLVSKRFYFLTQTQISTYGVHRIKLNESSSRGGGVIVNENRTIPPPARSISSIAYAPQARRNGPLMKKSFNSASNLCATSVKKPQDESSPKQTSSSHYDIRFFRNIQPKLLKYKHIYLDGTLSCDQFERLVVALDAARVEELGLRIKIERVNKLQLKQITSTPRFLCHLERLKLFWTNERENNITNYLSWTLFDRSINLKSLEIYLNDYKLDRIDDIQEYHQDFKEFNIHPQLSRIVFRRSISSSKLSLTTDNPPAKEACSYSHLIRNVLLREGSVLHVETDDSMLIEHLIKSSERLCTTRKLESLKCLTTIDDEQLLTKLFSAPNLGTHNLSLMIDNIEILNDLRSSLEDFRPVRLNKYAKCHMSLFMNDQKFVDIEDKIKSLICLCRLAHVEININSQQRVSIDCCHLMWSVGRALQSTGNNTITSGSSPVESVQCLFRITLQPANLFGLVKANTYTQITIPFGRNQCYNLDLKREDPSRHREILKSLKRDCYHSFVKSVRDNIPQDR